MKMEIIPFPLMMAKGLLTLNDAFPNALEGDGIFKYMTDLEFVGSPTAAEYLDFDYFGNYSGDKVASKLIHKCANDDGELSDSDIQILANVIKRKFANKWESLWTSLVGSDWLQNVNLTESGTLNESWNSNEERVEDLSNTNTREPDLTETTTETPDETIRRTPTLTDTITETPGQTTTKTLNLTDTKGGEDTEILTKTGSVAHAESGTTKETHKENGTRQEATAHTGAITDNGSSNGSGFSFGFNTTDSDGKPSSRDTATDNNTRTFTNTDTTTITPFTSVQDDITHGKTVTDTYNSLKDVDENTYNSTLKHEGTDTTVTSGTNTTETRKTGNETTTRTGENITTVSKTGSETTTFTGDNTITTERANSRENETNKNLSGFDFRKQDKVQALIALYTQPNLFPFFDIVYEDMDTVLCTPLFK